MSSIINTKKKVPADRFLSNFLRLVLTPFNKDRHKQSYFAGLMPLTQISKNSLQNVQMYFHDILNRVVVTVKDMLASILPHKWAEPVTIPLVY